MLFTTAKVERMLKRAGGVPVVYKGTTTFGSFDDSSDRVLETSEGFGVIAGGLSVVVATGSIPDPVIDDPITVDGIAYTINDEGKANDGPDRENDGAETRIGLRV